LLSNAQNEIVILNSKIKDMPVNRKDQKDHCKALFYTLTGTEPQTNDEADAYIMLQ